MLTPALARVRLKAIDLIAKTSSPHAAGGTNAPVGSRVTQTTGRQWQKRGVTDTAWIQQALTSYYVNVRDYGAAGDGVTDDRAAFNNAVAAVVAAGGGTVLIPPGNYAIYRSGVTTSILLTGTDARVMFLGCGRSSRVVMTGDAGGGGADWYLFSITNGAQRFVFKNMCFDGSPIFNIGVGQQHHGIRVGGTAVSDSGDVEFIDCYWNQFDGDGINLVGTSGVGAAAVDGVRVMRGVFTMDVGNAAGSRAGITAQRNVFGVTIASSYFTGGSDQLIDMETSGTGETRDIVITRNHVNQTAALVSTAVGLSGAAANDFYNVLFTNNVVYHGSTIFIDVRRIGFAGNIVTVFGYNTEGLALHLDGTRDSVFCHSQLFRSSPDNTAGAAINCNPGNAPPSALVIAGIMAENANDPVGGQDGILLESTVDVTVDGCQVFMAQGAANVGSLIRFRGITSDSINGRAYNNLLIATSSTVRNGITFACTGSDAVNHVAVGNMGRTVLNGVGLSASGGGTIQGGTVAANNVFTTTSQMIDMPAGSPQGVVVGSLGGANARGIWEFATNPQTVISALIGAIGSNRVGAAGTTFYVKEADAGLATGWAAK